MNFCWIVAAAMIGGLPAAGWAAEEAPASADTAAVEVALTASRGVEALLGVVGKTPIALLPKPGEALEGVPDGFESPRYGLLRLGRDHLISMAVDVVDGEERVVIDLNNNDDFADDTVLTWEGEYRAGEDGTALLPALEVQVDYTCKETPVPVPLLVERHQRDQIVGKSRLTLTDGVLVVVDTYRRGVFELDDQRWALALVPTGLGSRHHLFAHPGAALVVDVDQNGQLDGHPFRQPRERFKLGRPFDFAGERWQVTGVACDGSTMSLSRAAPPPTANPLAQRRPKFKAPRRGDQAPHFALASTQGDSVRLSDYRGKVVLLDFWATWCGPCRFELPHIKRAYDLYSDEGFEIVGISLDTRKSSLERFVAQNQMEWVQILQGRGVTPLKADYGVRSIPATFLIGPEGKILGSNYRGPQLVEAVRGAVEALGSRSD